MGRDDKHSNDEKMPAASETTTFDEASAKKFAAVVFEAKIKIHFSVLYAWFKAYKGEMPYKRHDNPFSAMAQLHKDQVLPKEFEALNNILKAQRTPNNPKLLLEDIHEICSNPFVCKQLIGKHPIQLLLDARNALDSKEEAHLDSLTTENILTDSMIPLDYSCDHLDIEGVHLLLNDSLLYSSPTYQTDKLFIKNITYRGVGSFKKDDYIEIIYLLLRKMHANNRIIPLSLQHLLDFDLRNPRVFECIKIMNENRLQHGVPDRDSPLFIKTYTDLLALENYLEKTYKNPLNTLLSNVITRDTIPTILAYSYSSFWEFLSSDGGTTLKSLDNILFNKKINSVASLSQSFKEEKKSFTTPRNYNKKLLPPRISTFKVDFTDSKTPMLDEDKIIENANAKYNEFYTFIAAEEKRLTPEAILYTPAFEKLQNMLDEKEKGLKFSFDQIFDIKQLRHIVSKDPEAKDILNKRILFIDSKFAEFKAARDSLINQGKVCLIRTEINDNKKQLALAAQKEIEEFKRYKTTDDTTPLGSEKKRLTEKLVVDIASAVRELKITTVAEYTVKIDQIFNDMKKELDAALDSKSVTTLFTKKGDMGKLGSFLKRLTESLQKMNVAYFEKEQKLNAKLAASETKADAKLSYTRK